MTFLTFICNLPSSFNRVVREMPFNFKDEATRCTVLKMKDKNCSGKVKRGKKSCIFSLVFLFQDKKTCLLHGRRVDDATQCVSLFVVSSQLYSALRVVSFMYFFVACRENSLRLLRRLLFPVLLVFSLMSIFKKERNE